MIQRLLALVSALVVAVTTPLHAQSEEQKADALKEFRRFFQKSKETSQRVEAVFTLKGMETADASLELFGLLNAREPEIREAAKDVLATYVNPKTFEAVLVELPDMKSQEQRAQVIEVLGKAGIKEALPVLREIALADKKASAAVRYEVAAALVRLKAVDAGDVLAHLLKDSDAVVRMGAAEAVGALRLKELGKQLLPLFNDSTWQVQSAAVQAVGKVRPQEAVEPLIELMRKGGRLKEETADALFKITKYDFGVKPDDWEAQWKKLMKVGWRIPSDEEVAKAEELRKKSAEFYGQKDGATTFGGITTTSTQVLFIIDVSGSMDELVVEKEKFDAGYESYEKLTIVKAELIRTIQNLTPNTNFNIVAFATELDTWKKWLVPANITNKSSAVDWVKRRKPIGGSEAQDLAQVGLGGAANLAAGKTNTLKALMFTFGIDPENPPVASATGSTAVSKNKLDTVFFLSDGRPSTGKLVDTNEILKAVREYNETQRVVFHTIAIGQFEKNFLRSLAEQNGGVFVDLGQ